MKLYCLIIILSFSSIAYGQSDTISHFKVTDFLGPEKLNEAKHIIELLGNELTEEIKVNKESLELLNEPNWLSAMANSLIKIDFNGDGKEDIIYEGRTNNEKGIFKIFIKADSGYKLFFSDHQIISGLIWKDKKVIKFYDEDYGCCNETNSLTKIYSVRYDTNNYPLFDLNYTRLSLKSVSKYPDYCLKTPENYTIVSYNAKLRFKPLIDDTTNHCCTTWGWSDQKGTTIGILDRGIKVRKISSFIDFNKTEWSFIEIPAEYPIHGSLLWYRKTDSTSFRAGWIESSSLIKQ